MQIISGKHTFLYSFLKHKANERKEVYLMDKEIAETLSMSTATLTRYLEILENAGLIIRRTSKPRKTSKGWIKARTIVLTGNEKKLAKVKGMGG